MITQTNTYYFIVDCPACTNVSKTNATRAVLQISSHKYDSIHVGILHTA